MSTQERGGPALARAFKRIKALNIATTESAPDKVNQCVSLGDAYNYAEIVVVPPEDVTAYTVAYGRWVRSDQLQDGSRELSRWCPEGSAVFAAAGVHSVRFLNNTDPVGIYVTAITGTPAADSYFEFWARGLNHIA